MRVLVTGGTGVLGQAFRPRAAGHEVRATGRAELDLFDAAAVGAVVRDVDAVPHQATRWSVRRAPCIRLSWSARGAFANSGREPMGRCLVAERLVNWRGVSAGRKPLSGQRSSFSRLSR
jgi:RmlD substrate binding domain